MTQCRKYHGKYQVVIFFDQSRVSEHQWVHHSFFPAWACEREGERKRYGKRKLSEADNNVWVKCNRLNMPLRDTRSAKASNIVVPCRVPEIDDQPTTTKKKSPEEILFLITRDGVIHKWVQRWALSVQACLQAGSPWSPPAGRWGACMARVCVWTPLSAINSRAATWRQAVRKQASVRGLGLKWV